LHSPLRVATFNTHKGFTHFNAHFSLPKQRAFLRALNVDLVFLQEVQSKHSAHPQIFEALSTADQLEYLADSVWNEFAYGKNAEYPKGHHGNAILSKYPIVMSVNQDISAHRIEQRGMLHCQIAIPSIKENVHAICLHLGLIASWRTRQLNKVAEYVEQYVPPDATLIIAGDFNDWRLHGGNLFSKRLNLQEAFKQTKGVYAKSFPACFPMLRMDRIYTRGFDVKEASAHAGVEFLRLSDHAVLTATLEI
jgi:endonuclease/exonuclease/phosphatase family metal-dependent hydrolase